MYIIEYLYITCEDHPERGCGLVWFGVCTEYQGPGGNRMLQWMEPCSVWNTSTSALGCRGLPLYSVLRSLVLACLSDRVLRALSYPTIANYVQPATTTENYLINPR